MAVSHVPAAIDIRAALVLLFSRLAGTGDCDGGILIFDNAGMKLIPRTGKILGDFVDAIVSIASKEKTKVIRITVYLASSENDQNSN